MIKRVRVITEWEIDIPKYVQAGIEAGWLVGTDEPDPITDEEANMVTYEAVEYCDAEDRLPRWARDAMRVTRHSIQIIK